MKTLITAVTLALLVGCSPAEVPRDSDTLVLEQKLLEVESRLDECIQTNDCKEFMMRNPMLEILTDTELTDEINNCQPTLEVTRCGQIMTRVSIKAMNAAVKLF